MSVGDYYTRTDKLHFTRRVYYIIFIIIITYVGTYLYLLFNIINVRGHYVFDTTCHCAINTVLYYCMCVYIYFIFPPLLLCRSTTEVVRCVYIIRQQAANVYVIINATGPSIASDRKPKTAIIMHIHIDTVLLIENTYQMYSEYCVIRLL